MGSVLVEGPDRCVLHAAVTHCDSAAAAAAVDGARLVVRQKGLCLRPDCFAVQLHPSHSGCELASFAVPTPGIRLPWVSHLHKYRHVHVLSTVLCHGLEGCVGTF